MTSVILSQGTSLPGRTAVLCLLVGATTAYLWYRFPLAHSTNTLSPAKPTSHSTRSTRRGVHLGQVNPDKNEADTNIDIIAIHGLDTKSPDTWTWVDPSDPTNTCNWLADPRMLPSRVGAARIFTCDWPADLLQPSGLVQKTIEEENRPVFFIASCLGGIVLAKALVDAGKEHLPFNRAIGGQEASKLLDHVKGSTFDLETLKGKTSLPRKFLPRVLGWLHQEKQLVDEKSANLDIVSKPLPLDRPHVLTNKFGGPDCVDYKKVSGKIEELLGKIREGTPLAQADTWIRDKHYTEDKLKVERLSGEAISMDHCYINLAIIEQPDKTWNRPEPRSEADSATQSSPFSRSARLRVETPDKNIQVELPSLFNPRKRRDVEVQPRRILIRGRAGVGKTTLCKKIVYEFTHRTWSQWNELFDRVLWVPLRHLKLAERQMPGYSFSNLFSHEYFSLPNQRPDLAKALSDTLDETKSRTLFILDGLDELSQDLSDGSDMFRFLKELLDQPNVIIMSRPSGTLPTGLRGIDIELETIGFYPDQISEYLERTVPEKANEIHSFLQGHVLLLDLVRIPIQLDALCFIWDRGLDPSMRLDTMTAIYRAIEHTLWKKDIVQLEKTDGGKPVTKFLIQDSDPHEIGKLAKDEICFLEGLAFTGLYNDVIDFESRHRNDISTHFGTPFLLDKTLPRLSFLRTSDPLSKHHNRSYHFLHLTYQEYFAARYSVRQWKTRKPLRCLKLSNRENEDMEPATFLQEHKYDPRYDIFWRFVTGLLDDDGEALGFFQAVEAEPRDLLGPTHQRLVMHCLSEVQRKESTFKDLRTKLEKQLEQWLLFECGFTQNSRLTRETECPEQVLTSVLKRASEDARPTLLGSLSTRTTVPSSVIDVTSLWLNDCASSHLCSSILRILRHQHKGLPDTILEGIAARLEDDDWFVRQAAVEALQGRDLTEEMLQCIAARLEDDDWLVRQAAIKALQGRDHLAEEMLQDIAARLKHDDGGVRQGAIRALQGRELTEEMLQGIAARLEDDDQNVRRAAIEALINQTALSREVLSQYVNLLYKALLQESFGEHLYWLASDSSFIGVGLRRVSLRCKQGTQLSDDIRKIWNNFGNYPSP
ncbi:hypothetical protein N658DRAFT_335672 [Parathielavia hyrcaniae]|uniref:NACHT domain-containing protein n=1 Tax=Parathielavia hyrcaniae TaxID=113614 RepID=A0AAN6SXR1_9PEZI|nr:hypothetical protein N658DRAFT_335672 [Parathielavia hyrcaniae]